MLRRAQHEELDGAPLLPQGRFFFAAALVIPGERGIADAAGGKGIQAYQPSRSHDLDSLPSR